VKARCASMLPLKRERAYREPVALGSSIPPQQSKLKSKREEMRRKCSFCPTCFPKGSRVQCKNCQRDVTLEVHILCATCQVGVVVSRTHVF
jgi:hypothetical protein